MRIASTLRHLVIALAAVVCIGCGSTSHSGGSGTGGTPTVSTVTVTPSTASVAIGNTQQFTATARMSDGSSKVISTSATWSSSSSTVATIDASGLLKAVATGSASITATSGSVKSAAITVTVVAPVTSSVTITPANPVIPLGGSQQFKATATGSDGSMSDVTSQITWSASPANVVTISASGLAQSMGKGNFTITGTLGAVTASVTGSVGDAVARSVSLSPSAGRIAKGATQQFSAVATLTDGSMKPVTSGLSFSTSNAAVASISSSGLATGVGAGTAMIGVSYSSGSGSPLVATATLTVASGTTQSITLKPLSATIAKGSTQQFTASALLSDGSTLDVTGSATWSSSSGAVASINASGLATALTVGTSNITASQGSVSSAPAVLTVSAATLVSINITPSAPVVSTGGTLQLKATGTFSDGTTQDLSSQLTYTSSDPAVATVSSSGVLMGVGPGTATITATAPVSLGSKSVTFTVTTSNATLSSITIAPDSLSLAKGTSQKLTATANYSDGSTADVSSTVAWSSTNSSVASVDATGNVMALGVGNATITGMIGSVTATASVAVTPASVVSISLMPPSVTINVGQLLPITVTATFSDGTTQDVTADVQFSSSAPTIATISNDLANIGVVTGLLPGNVTITGTLDGVSANAQVTVAAGNPLVSIQFQPNSLSLAVGTSQLLKAIGVYQDGSTVDLTANVKFASSNTAAATVDALGNVIAVGLGSGNITASYTSPQGQVVTGTLPINVIAAALSSIQVTASSLLTNVGLPINLGAIGTYTDGATQNLTNLVHWSSSNPALAVVSNLGVVTPLGTGTADIMASFDGVTGSATVTIGSALLQSLSIGGPSGGSLPLGTDVQLSATATYSDGSTYNAAAQVSWTTSNPAVAVVNSAGVIHPVAVGQVTITGTVGVTQATLSLAVTPAGVTLTSLSISPTNVSLVGSLLQLLLNGGQQFTLTAHYSDGSSAVVSDNIHWTVGNTLVGTLDAVTGLFTPSGNGATTVTATYGGQSVTTNVTVSLLPLL